MEYRNIGFFAHVDAGKTTLSEQLLLHSGTILEATFVIPADCAGRIMSDVQQMRGEITETESDETAMTLKALVPVATSLDYPAQFASVTHGKGAMSTALHDHSHFLRQISERFIMLRLTDRAMFQERGQQFLLPEEEVTLLLLFGFSFTYWYFFSYPFDVAAACDDPLGLNCTSRTIPMPSASL